MDTPDELRTAAVSNALVRAQTKPSSTHAVYTAPVPQTTVAFAGPLDPSPPRLSPVPPTCDKLSSPIDTRHGTHEAAGVQVELLVHVAGARKEPAPIQRYPRK